MSKIEQIEYLWHPSVILEKIPIFQVYGFALTKEDLVPLVRDKNEKRFTLPGGRIEKGETAKEALIREFNEETQLTPKKIKTLGSLVVTCRDSENKIVDQHQQIRFFCRIDDIEDFIPEKDGFETVERIFVPYRSLADYIDWIKYPSGEKQYQDFLKYIENV